MQSKTTRNAKSLPAKLPAGGVWSCKTTSQLDRFSVKCPVMASYHVWFAWKLLGGYLCRSCVWSVFAIVIMGKRKARRRKKEVAINGKAILYLFWIVSTMRLFQVYSNLSFLCFGYGKQLSLSTRSWSPERRCRSRSVPYRFWDRFVIRR